MTSPYDVVFVSQIASISYQTTSSILRPDLYHDGTKPHIISSYPLEVHGNASAPSVVRIGNGGLGPTGILAKLCNEYLRAKRLNNLLRIEWVCNHSRYTQVALQAGVVDIALTYEREQERAAAREGWSRTVDILCHDHFVLAGPREDSAGVAFRDDIGQSLKRIAIKGYNGDECVVFHTRGDGSATMHKEHTLWDLAKVPSSMRNTATWYRRLPQTPLDALRHANEEHAYLLTDRATFLLAKSKGEIDNMVIFNEGSSVLLNTCAILVRSDEDRKSVLNLAQWLLEEHAQDIIEHYGRDTKVGVPLFTRKGKEEVDEMGEWVPRMLLRTELTTVVPPKDELKKLYPATRIKHSKRSVAIGNPGSIHTMSTSLSDGLTA
jgi:ABC-type tungstate transport system permease subunit